MGERPQGARSVDVAVDGRDEGCGSCVFDAVGELIAGTADHGLRSAVAKTVNASGPPSRSTRRDSLDAAAGSAINMYPERHR